MPVQRRQAALQLDHVAGIPRRRPRILRKPQECFKWFQGVVPGLT